MWYVYGWRFGDVEGHKTTVICIGLQQFSVKQNMSNEGWLVRHKLWNQFTEVRLWLLVHCNMFYKKDNKYLLILQNLEIQMYTGL